MAADHGTGGLQRELGRQYGGTAFRPGLRYRLARWVQSGVNRLHGRDGQQLLCPADRGPAPEAHPDELRSPAADAPGSFVLYRILGNDLVPRHRPGQHLQNVEFILDNEPELAGCEKCWVINRIVDPDQEAALIERIERAGQRYLHIPFDWDEYARVGWDTDGLPDPDFLRSRTFRLLGRKEQALTRLRLYRHKNNYVMNNNGARNAALADGRRRARWTLPWDGNCFLNALAWADLRTRMTAFGEARYGIVPMQRLVDNHRALEIDTPFGASEEPQILFRHDALEWFDEAHPYGRWPKADLLCRLGVPGRWNYWIRRPWDLPVPDYSPEAGQFVEAGWVMRLFSGERRCEIASQYASRHRNRVRAEAVLSFIDQLDHEVGNGRHHPATAQPRDDTPSRTTAGAQAAGVAK